MPAGEVTITTVVGAPVEEAFAAFTEHVDRWWGRERPAETVVRFEGKRLIAVSVDGAELLATVTKWIPPTRLELQWSGPVSLPGDTVIVAFDPEKTGTRVTVRHRRAGIKPEETRSAVIGLWWGDLLSRMQGANQILE
ncbi:MAG: SRPBCC domain-containing protein [Acidimicrobiia bacterium]